MHVYWVSVFILPKIVIKEIDKILKGFLWCQGELSRGKAKVAWKQVCRPKNEGGLGIKDLEQWNEVLMAKHLWNVASRKESIWVKWIHEAKLKGECIWMVKSDQKASSGWKHILGLRDKIKEHCKCQVGNGATIFLWHDKLWGPEPLSKVIPMETIEHAGFRQNMKIKDMVNNGQWNWPIDWPNEFPTLQAIPVPNLCASSDDTYVWCTNDERCVSYFTNNAWKDLRLAGPKVDWYDIVWFSNCTPKHSFILWIGITRKALTHKTC